MLRYGAMWGYYKNRKGESVWGKTTHIIGFLCFTILWYKRNDWHKPRRDDKRTGKATLDMGKLAIINQRIKYKDEN